MLFSNILVAFDGSDLSTKALDKAIQLAKANPGCSIEVLNVLQFPNLILGEAYIAATPAMKESMLEETEKMLETAEQKLKSQAVSYQITTIEGLPAKTIVDFAKKKKSDLIVIGSRGLNGFKELVLGSVSHNVVQHSDIPVLVVK